MAVDPELIKSFEAQIKVLTTMQEGIQKSIETANGQLDLLKNGEPFEKVFGVPLKQSPVADGGGGKHHP
jgi:hypothetical protein